MAALRNKKRRTALTIIILVFWTSLSCGIISSSSEATSKVESSSDLEATLAVQGTWIAHLSTQVGKQDQTNENQDGLLEYLFTQMPVTSGVTTPIPPGAQITPTAYNPTTQESGTNITPTFTPYLDIEYPPDMRTSIEEIDRVIDAVLNHDLDARLALVRYTRSACTTEGGLGGPPTCQPGEEDGTLVEAFPVSSGEGVHVRPEAILKTLDFQVRGLFAVYRVPEDAYERDYWPAGEYGVVFTSEEGNHPQAITVIVDQGRIVRLVYNIGWPPFEVIRERSDDFILPPIR